jgi:hypothetical protein
VYGNDEAPSCASFSIHYFLTVVPFDAAQCRLLAASLSEPQLKFICELFNDAVSVSVRKVQYRKVTD